MLSSRREHGGRRCVVLPPAVPPPPLRWPGTPGGTPPCTWVRFNPHPNEPDQVLFPSFFFHLLKTLEVSRSGRKVFETKEVQKANKRGE